MTTIPSENLPPIIITSVTKKDTTPPLLSLQVSNPVVYLRQLWKKILGNEGVELKLKIKPLTAIVLLLIIMGTTFSVGWFSALLSQVPVLNQLLPTPLPSKTPSPTPYPWKDTAYTGVLRQANDKFYLVTNEAEAISLEVPTNVILTKHIGKRILAVGKLNINTGILQVTDASDLELLIQAMPIPTSSEAPQQNISLEE